MPYYALYGIKILKKTVRDLFLLFCHAQAMPHIGQNLNFN